MYLRYEHDHASNITDRRHMLGSASAAGDSPRTNRDERYSYDGLH